MKRAFLPGIADLLFIGLLLTRVQPTLFHDGDTGWHLWAGSAVLDRGPGPVTDTQSFTREGVPFENVEWLGEAFLALAYRHAGYLGVGLLAGLVFAGSCAWLYRRLLGGSGDPVSAILVTVLTGQVLLLQFLARPLIFSFPLFLGAVALARSPDRRSAVGLVLLTAVWANVHPSAYFAPALALFFWLRQPGVNPRLWAVLGSLAALGATPWGWSWIPDMIASNRGYFGLVEEWGPPRFHEFRFVPYLLGILLAAAARRGAPPLSTSELIWGVGWLGAALLSVRLGPYAFLAWAPYLARDLAHGDLVRLVPPVHRLWSGIRDGLRPMEVALRPRLWPGLATLAVWVFAARLGPLFPSMAEGFPAERFPRAALAEADRIGLGPRVFCDYAWGGYVGWASEGRWKTYIDGRAGFFGSDLLRDYLAVYTADPDWEETIGRHRPQWLLVSPSAPIVEAALRSREWRVVYQDGTSAILIPSHQGT